MKSTLSRTMSLVFSSLFIVALHLPFVFAKSKPAVSVGALNTVANAPATDNTMNVSEVYSSLDLSALGLSKEAFNYAVKGFELLKQQGKISKSNILSIADFTKSSAKKRLFVIDLENRKILFNTYVAHGQGSGEEFANRFSNIPESLQSSLGFYRTSDTYIGKHGYSMHLEGMESGINDKANERAIVLHGAPYVSENYIRSKGYIGRSWGCPAVPEKLTRPIIEKIKNGSCLFIYSERQNYLNRSRIINS
jgi:L,D-transpeptidase catalytic domain